MTRITSLFIVFFFGFQQRGTYAGGKPFLFGITIYFTKVSLEFRQISLQLVSQMNNNT